MGNPFSAGLDRWKHPEYAPSVTRPEVFEPLDGFPKGRKKREMIATYEEMDRFNLEIERRDYCAHTFIDWQKCVLKFYPAQTSYECAHKRHVHELCEWEDYILRLKEYERERRLLKRELQLKQKEQQNSNQIIEAAH